MNYSLKDRTYLACPGDEWIFDQSSDSKQIENIMIDMMLSNNGIGLAANQIGLPKTVFVMGSYTIPDFPDPFALFNPKIISSSPDTESDNEGCLSFPGLFLKIKRPKEIFVEFQDNLGNRHTMHLTGLASRCFQHEYDHLRGVCFVDKVSTLKLKYATRKSKRYDRT
jgi:peptide deformylase